MPTLLPTMYGPCGRHKRVLAVFLLLLPGLFSGSDGAATYATIYLGTIGFITGLLAVSTTAQIFITHLIARFNDSVSLLPTMSRPSRLSAYFAQIFLTVFMAGLVFSAPFTDVSRVITGDPGRETAWSLPGRIIAVIFWLLGNTMVLLDTVVYTFASAWLLLTGRELGGALLVLLAAAGASDFVSLQRIKDALAVAWELDNAIIKPTKFDKKLAVAFLVGDPHSFTTARIASEDVASNRTTEIERAVTTSLTQVGASPVDILGIAIQRSGFRLHLAGAPRPALFHPTADGLETTRLPHVRSRLTPEQWHSFCTFVNAGREPHWRLTGWKARIRGEELLCDFRVVALDLLHAHHRMASWRHYHAVLRNTVVHWVRSRMLAEWCIALPLKRGFVLNLNDKAEDESENLSTSWLSGAQRVLASFASIKSIPLVVGEVDERRGASEAESFQRRIGNWWEERRRNTPVSKHLPHCHPAWKEDEIRGFDFHGHGNDWSEVTIRPQHGPREEWTLEASERQKNLKELLEISGSDARLGEMGAPEWFSLLIMDMVMCFKFMKKKRAMENQERVVIHLGAYAFGMIRVATKRSGTIELYLDAVTKLRSEQTTLSIFFLSLGTALLNHFDALGNAHTMFNWWRAKTSFLDHADHIEKETEQFAQYHCGGPLPTPPAEV